MISRSPIPTPSRKQVTVVCRNELQIGLHCNIFYVWTDLLTCWRNNMIDLRRMLSVETANHVKLIKVFSSWEVIVLYIVAACTVKHCWQQRHFHEATVLLFACRASFTQVWRHSTFLRHPIRHTSSLTIMLTPPLGAWRHLWTTPCGEFMNSQSLTNRRREDSGPSKIIYHLVPIQIIYSDYFLLCI